jgi:predicted nuclease with TOPRIM domain
MKMAKDKRTSQIEELFSAEVKISKELNKKNIELTLDNIKLQTEADDLREENRGLKIALAQADDAYIRLAEKNETLSANLEAMSTTMMSNDEALKQMYGTNAFLSGKLTAYEKTAPLDQTTEGVQNEQPDRNA